MNLPHSWRSAWECARDTAVLAVFIAAMIWLLLFVLPASVGADGPRWDGDRACRPLPQCAAMVPGWPSGPMAYPYLPSTQLVPILPSQPLILPAAPSAVILVTGTQPQGATIWVTSSTPSSYVVNTSPASVASTPTATPAPPPPPPTPAPTVAPAPTVQAPQYQGPAIQPLNCSSLGCAMGDTPADNDTNSDTVPSLTQAESMQPRADVSDIPGLIASLGGSHATCIASIVKGESQFKADAYNPSGASGLGQWMPRTWASTPQGKAGLSPFDPVADIEAMAWTLDGHIGGMSNWSGTRYTDGCYNWLPQLARMVR